MFSIRGCFKAIVTAGVKDANSVHVGIGSWGVTSRRVERRR